MMIRKLITATIAAIALSATSGVQAVADHAHAGQDTAQLQLDHGRKWPTDAPLRQGMNNIRTAMAKALPAIHDGQLNANDYATLAGKIQDDMAYVVTNCKLDPAADAQLHIVLSQLGEGVQNMKGSNDRQRGAIMVVEALNAYGAHFDHPRWQSLGR
jgi:hypothetical protein